MAQGSFSLSVTFLFLRKEKFPNPEGNSVTDVLSDALKVCFVGTSAC